MLNRRLWSSLLTLLLLASACSQGSSDGAGSTGDDGAAPTADVEGDGSGDAPDETTPTTQADIPDEPGLPMVDGVDIEQLTDKRGGGPRPTLAWSAVDGSDSYTVVVYDTEGDPWWSWSGPGTEVVIGGVETDIEIGGPRADAGIRWLVMAFDENGNMIGTSGKRSIEP